MIKKELIQIELKDIQDLVENYISESKTLDYKLEFPPKLNDSEKKEFLADVSAFANTFGGDLIYGIKEEEGIAKEIIGFEIENIDEWKLKLESIIRDGIDPRINYEIREIKLEDKKYIIILRIKESFIKPHWISFQKNHKVFLRGSTGKYESELSELRDLFLSMDQLSTKINDFKLRRLSVIELNDSYMNLNKGLKIIVHIVPVDPQQSINLFDEQELNSKFEPFYARGWNHRVNIDGFLTYSPTAHSYTQIYKNGTIEAVRSSDDTVEKFYYMSYEKETIEYIESKLGNLVSIGIKAPFYISLCFLDIKGYILKRGNIRASEHGYSYDRNLLDTGNIIINDINNIEEKLKPLFDILWNAFGYMHSRNYNEKGNWTGNG